MRLLYHPPRLCSSLLHATRESETRQWELFFFNVPRHRSISAWTGVPAGARAFLVRHRPFRPKRLTLKIGQLSDALLRQIQKRFELAS
jgi:hypothetical protein